MLPRDKNIGSVHRHVYALRGDRVPHLRNMSLAPAPPAAFCDAEGCTAHLLAALSRIVGSCLAFWYYYNTGRDKSVFSIPVPKTTSFPVRFRF